MSNLVITPKPEITSGPVANQPSHTHSHLSDNQFGGAEMPRARYWLKFGAELARRSGLTSAIFGSGLGLSGFGGLAEKRAEAGIVLTSGAVETSKIPGAAAATDNGGPLVGVEALFADGTKSVASGIGFNTADGSGLTYTSGHFRLERNLPGTVFSVITGPDLNNPTGRYEVTRFQTAPGYAGDATFLGIRYGPRVVVLKCAYHGSRANHNSAGAAY